MARECQPASRGTEMKWEVVARKGERALSLMRVKTPRPRQMYWRYAVALLMEMRK